MAKKKKNNTNPQQGDQPQQQKKESFMHKLMTRKPLGFAGLIILIVILFIAIFADVLAPYPMEDGTMQTDILNTLAKPSKEHLLGTDNLGRDVLSYLIYGARTSAVLAIACTLITTTISVLLGTLSAVIGGWFDLIVQRIVEAIMCIPGTVFLLILMSMLGNGMPQLIAAISIPGGITGSRGMRANAFTVKDAGYVRNSEMLGCTTWWKTIHHVIPNMMPMIIIGACGSIGGVVMQEAGMNFLGYGVKIGTPSWGYMITNQGRANMYAYPMLAVYPGICISVMVFAATMFGDALRDLLDPRLQGGAGTYNAAKLDKFKQEMMEQYHPEELAAEQAKS